MKTIVAAYDEHESATRTLERATELAQAIGARLIVLSIAPPVEPAPSVETLQPSFGSTPVESARLAENPLVLSPHGALQPDAVDREAEHVERAHDILARGGVDAEIIQASGDEIDQLLDLAAARRAELLVVGAHRSTVWQRLFGGTDEQRLARRAGCDLLIVR